MYMAGLTSLLGTAASFTPLGEQETPCGVDTGKEFRLLVTGARRRWETPNFLNSH